MRITIIYTIICCLSLSPAFAAEETGKIKREYYDSGKVLSETNCFDKDDDGFYREYYENGNLKKNVEYRGGQLHGDYRDYCEDGTLRVKFKYKNNKRDGIYTLYYPNGTLEYQGLYTDGKEEGEHTVYYPTGIIAATATYTQGKEVGPAKTYYVDAALREEFNFKDGIKDGDYREYHADGILKKQAIYKQGKLIHSENYDEQRDMYMTVLESKLITKQPDADRQQVLNKCQSQLLGIEFACNPEWDLARDAKKLTVTISREPKVMMEIEETDQQVRFMSEFNRKALVSMGRYADDFHIERFEHCNREIIKVNGFLKDDPNARISDFYLIDHNTLHSMKFSVKSKQVWEKYKWIVKEVTDSIRFIKHSGNISFQEADADKCEDIIKKE